MKALRQRRRLDKHAVPLTLSLGTRGISVSNKEIFASSVQFMLAEYNRIHALEMFVRETGVKRIHLYISIMSLVLAGLTFLAHFVSNQKQTFLVASIALVFLAIIGYITLNWLVQRWILSVIFLRKLARIRRWFVERDPELVNRLVYSDDEHKPSFFSDEILSRSLITLVLILNSVFASVGCAFAVMAIITPSFMGSVLLAGMVIGAAGFLWFLQKRKIVLLLERMEQDPFVAFPRVKSKSNDVPKS